MWDKVPQVIITEGAVRGLERCRHFLAENNPSLKPQAALSAWFSVADGRITASALSFCG